MSLSAKPRPVKNIKPVCVLVIGGGASGLAAAVTAARAGASVYVADRMDRVGKKILASGDGRCNLSNIGIKAKHYHGAGAKSAFSIISRFDMNFVPDFFRDLGVLISVEDGSRLYPGTFQSSTVLNALRSEAARLGVTELVSHEAVSIIKGNGVFRTRFTNGRTFVSDRLIVAAGGAASPFLGSDGSGWRLMREFGHRTAAAAPALTQLCLAPQGIRGLKGVRTRAGLTLLTASGGDDSRYAAGYSETGELLFTEYGLSGIPSLNVSNRLAPYLETPDAAGNARADTPEKNVKPARGAPAAQKKAGMVKTDERAARQMVSVDLFPNYSLGEMLGFMDRQIGMRPDAPIGDILGGVMHKNIAAHIIKNALPDDFSTNRQNGGESRLAKDIRPADVRRLAGAMKDWRHALQGVKGFESAQAAYGGLSFDDFNLENLESKIVRGLFAAGEIMDVVGDCGGYNLHWAWLSGYLAGAGAASV